MKQQLQNILKETIQTLWVKEMVVDRAKRHNKTLKLIYRRLDLLDLIEKRYKITTLVSEDGTLQDVSVMEKPP
jgi:hypothetical protein